MLLNAIWSSPNNTPWNLIMSQGLNNNHERNVYVWKLWFAHKIFLSRTNMHTQSVSRIWYFFLREAQPARLSVKKKKKSGVRTYIHTHTYTHTRTDETDAVLRKPCAWRRGIIWLAALLSSFFYFKTRVFVQCLYFVPSDKTQSLHSIWNVSVEIWEGWAPGVGLHQLRGPSLALTENWDKVRSLIGSRKCCLHNKSKMFRVERTWQRRNLCLVYRQTQLM